MAEAEKWIIHDWAGNRMFLDKTFDSFEDGWEFVRANVPEEDWEEIYVVPFGASRDTE